MASLKILVYIFPTLITVCSYLIVSGGSQHLSNTAKSALDEGLQKHLKTPFYSTSNVSLKNNVVRRDSRRPTSIDSTALKSTLSSHQCQPSIQHQTSPASKYLLTVNSNCDFSYLIPELKKYTNVDLDHFGALTSGLVNPRDFKLSDEKSQFIERGDDTFEFKIYLQTKNSFRLNYFLQVELAFLLVTISTTTGSDSDFYEVGSIVAAGNFGKTGSTFRIYDYQFELPRTSLSSDVLFKFTLNAGDGNIATGTLFQQLTEGSPINAGYLPSGYSFRIKAGVPLRGILSRAGFWEIYIFRDQIEEISSTLSAIIGDNYLKLACSSDSFESSQIVSCGIFAEISKNAVPWSSLTNVPAEKIAGLPILSNVKEYDASNNLHLNYPVMFTASRLGVPSLMHTSKVHLDDDFKLFITGSYMKDPSEEEPEEDLDSDSDDGNSKRGEAARNTEQQPSLTTVNTDHIMKGVCIKDFLGRNGLTNHILSIDSAKYKKVLINICFHDEKNKVVIKTDPNITGTGAALASLISTSQLNPNLKRKLEEYLEEYRLLEITIENSVGSFRKTCVKIGFKRNAYIIIANKFQLDKTEINICELSDGTFEMSGDGEEFIFESKANVEVHKTRDGTNNWYISGRLKIFDSDYFQTVAGQTFLPSAQMEIFNLFTKFPMIDTRFYYEGSSGFEVFESDAVVEDDTFKLQSILRNQPTDLSLCLYKQTQTSITKVLSYLYNDVQMDIGYIQKFQEIKISVQQVHDFHEHYTSTTMPAICGAVETNARQYFEDFAGGILIEGKNLDMSCNEDVLSPQSKNICKFFKQALDLGANNIAAISFYGKIEQNSLYLEATIGRDITLGTGIKIKGNGEESIRASIHASWDNPRKHGRNRGVSLIVPENERPPVKRNYVLRNEIIGYLSFGDLTSTVDVPAKLRITRDNIVITIADVTIPNSFLGIPNVKETIIRSFGFPLIQQTGAAQASFATVDKLVFHSDLKIGSNTGQEIEFLGEPKYTEQFVYTNDRSKNKFYACKRDDAITTDDVLKAFGSLGKWPLEQHDYYYDLVKDVEGTLNMFLIKGLVIHEPCFTYHNSDTPWNIASRGLNASKGLRLYGYFGVLKYITIDVFLMPFIYPKFVSNKIEIEFASPIKVKIYVSEPLEISMTKEKEKHHYIKMVRSKTDQDAGPVIELFFTNGGYDHGYLEGFLETIGYKAFGKLNIQTIDNIDEIQTRGHVVTFEPNYNHPDSANDEVLFKEGFTLNGIIKYDSDFYLQQFEFQVNLQHQSYTSKVMESYQSLFTSTMDEIRTDKDNTNEYEPEITRRLQIYVETQNKATAKIKRLKRELKNLTEDYSKKSKLLRKSCKPQCNEIYTPGFKWDKSCRFSEANKNQSCLKFSKQAHLATDVDCLVRCRVAQLSTKQEVVKIKRQTQISLSQLESNEDLDDLVKEIIADISPKHNEMLTNIQTAAVKYSSLNQLKSQQIQITSFGMASPVDVKIKEIPPRISFDLSYTMNSEPDSVSMELKIDGSIFNQAATKLLDSVVTTDDNNLIKDTQDLLAGIQGSYQEIIRKIDAWERINERKLDELRATASKGRTPVLKNRKKNGNTNRESIQEYEKPNVVFTKSLKSMNFGKNAPWNVLKANDLFANKPKTQPIAKQVQLQVIEMTRNVTDQEKRWLIQVQKGLEKWEQEFKNQIDALNVKGPALIQEDINAILQPSGSLKYEEFMKQMSEDADKSFKKAFVSKDYSFQNLVKHLIQPKTNVTLNEMRDSINESHKMMAEISKRTIICHDEM